MFCKRGVFCKRVVCLPDALNTISTPHGPGHIAASHFALLAVSPEARSHHRMLLHCCKGTSSML